MNTKRQLSRITIDIPKEDHQKFKAMAAINGKTMRELVVESIQEHLKAAQSPVTANIKKDNHE
jgi:hypothetical protein